MPLSPPSPDLQTRWPIVWAAFGAGIVAATHIGKLPPALPDMRLDLGAGLVLGGWIASVISAIACAFGLVAGGIADRFGQRRVLVFGLVTLAAGSLFGALSATGLEMLAARFVEGIGFTAATIASASVIAQATAPRDRHWALGIWAAYMPIGFAGMMIVAALVLEGFGWRILWTGCAALTLAWAAVMLKTTAGCNRTRPRPVAAATITANVRDAIRSGGGLLSAACFGLYAAQHISMMSWLPTYMIEVHGSGTLLAASVPAIVLLFNAGGNYVAAWAMNRGVPIWLLLALGSAGMGLTELGIFSSALPDGVRLALAFAFGVVGGFIPAASLASAPFFASTPALIGTMNGLMVTGSNTGQLFGPPALAAMRQSAGTWEGILWLVVALAAASTVLALLLRAFENRTAGVDVERTPGAA